MKILEKTIQRNKNKNKKSVPSEQLTVTPLIDVETEQSLPHKRGNARRRTGVTISSMTKGWATRKSAETVASNIGGCQKITENKTESSDAPPSSNHSKSLTKPDFPRSIPKQVSFSDPIFDDIVEAKMKNCDSQPPRMDLIPPIEWDSVKGVCPPAADVERDPRWEIYDIFRKLRKTDGNTPLNDESKSKLSGSLLRVASEGSVENRQIESVARRLSDLEKPETKRDVSVDMLKGTSIPFTSFNDDSMVANENLSTHKDDEDSISSEESKENNWSTNDFYASLPNLESPNSERKRKNNNDNASFFTVWRPTSADAIHNLMDGKAVGKALNVKGKSAKCGRLSGYVPYVQIHEDNHKKLCCTPCRSSNIRIYFKSIDGRAKACQKLEAVKDEMTRRVTLTRQLLRERDDNDGWENVDEEEDNDSTCLDPRIKNITALLTNRRENKSMTHAEDSETSSFFTAVELSEKEEKMSLLKSVSLRGISYASENDRMEETKVTIGNWEMNDPKIVLLDHCQNAYGIEVPERLFWETYIERGIITREAGSELDIGRSSEPAFMDLNTHSSREGGKDGSPRTVTWQEDDCCPLDPRTLLVAYEEDCIVKPVASDFDPFLIGTRGVNFVPFPNDQMNILKWQVKQIKRLLGTEVSSKCWTNQWLNILKEESDKGFHPESPPFGYGDEVSYDIISKAVWKLRRTGAVRHGPESFNFYFPQEIDDYFLVVSDHFGAVPWRYLTEKDLREFLKMRIEEGFVFPMNVKWALCDPGWYDIWNDLVHTEACQQAMDSWFPPESGLRDEIKAIHEAHPGGFLRSRESNADVTCKGIGLDPDIAALELKRYIKLRRVKRKVRAILLMTGKIGKT
mmetsp:Transcript_304/g.544  ORF Transcript_304/g.544 Transcript_304/m.544 type:complete len:856 (+) Transcript_304:135-2702(+)